MSGRLKILARVIVWLGLFFGSMAHAAEVVLCVDPRAAPANFAATEVESAFRLRGATVSRAGLDGIKPQSGKLRIVLASTADEDAMRALREAGAKNPVGLQREGFCLQRTGVDNDRTIWVIGEGPGGVMYGGLELAEQVRLKGPGAIEEMERSPHFALRGAKFNLPLDARTPSYTDASDSGQQNIAEVWSFEFWTTYLDALARNRYNYVSLWNLHPFPSMVKVPAYPDVALDDVHRSTGKWAENYSTRTEDIATPGILRSTETLKRLTINEKIEFWRHVMRYAKDRNIDVYIITWNIYTYGTGGKYGITDAIDNPVTIDYFRESVRALFQTYPLLAGIGLTAGENMGTANSSLEEKENWLFATYGQGVLDVVRDQPGRKIRFIHRQHETGARDIARTFAPLVGHPDIDFVFSFKYAQAHALSSTTQSFHQGFVESLGERKTLWTLRNDDSLLFRWGAPDFVREFIRNMPTEPTLGIYYGSDMWVWGREFLSLEPETPRQLEVEKHWYHWLLWGRLGYDPTLGNDRLVAILAQRYPGVQAQTLFDAWQHASMIYPLTTGFHWGQYDFQWYIEACKSRPGPAQTASGFHDVNRFITLGPHPGTDNISIPRYVEAVVAGQKLPGTTPLAVAAQLHRHADAALAAVAVLDGGTNKELRQTLADIRVMALLGKYYAHKIAGATELALFRQTRESGHQEAAVEHLTHAANFWGSYARLATSLYRNPFWTNRVGYVDWRQLGKEVERDIAIAREPLGKAH